MVARSISEILEEVKPIFKNPIALAMGTLDRETRSELIPCHTTPIFTTDDRFAPQPLATAPTLETTTGIRNLQSPIAKTRVCVENPAPLC
ncbi:hypothetical protein C7B76_10390 [filamentous cyanobacterium CCP2]|nr:hypothetical protein C7B76_10390 [filamentous cyanobacterium CCP2]